MGGGGGETSFSLRVDLDGRADDGPRGALFDGLRDNVRGSVEGLEGTPRADILIGNGRANKLEGGDGADRLVAERVALTGSTAGVATTTSRQARDATRSSPVGAPTGSGAGRERRRGLLRILARSRHRTSTSARSRLRPGQAMRRRAAILLVLGAALLTPASAGAATVSIPRRRLNSGGRCAGRRGEPGHARPQRSQLRHLRHRDSTGCRGRLCALWPRRRLPGSRHHKHRGEPRQPQRQRHGCGDRGW